MLRLPSRTELPDGPRRAFVEELFVHYREAGRPQLRVIANWIKDNDELSGSASAETIRRVLTGIAVPRTWPTVEAILEALCSLADRNPNEQRSEYWTNGQPPPTIREELKNRWNAALDDYDVDEEMPALPPRRKPKPPRPRQDFDDPWASAPAPAALRSRPPDDDEPPF